MPEKGGGHGPTEECFPSGTRGRASPQRSLCGRAARRGRTLRPTFARSHAAFASSAALQRIIAAADVAKLGIDPKMIATFADANRAAHEAMIVAGTKLAAKRTASLKAGRS